MLTGVEFVGFSHQIAQWFWEGFVVQMMLSDTIFSWRTTVIPMLAGLLVLLQMMRTLMLRHLGGEEGVFCHYCFFTQQAFIHDVNGSANEILRQDATLPSPTQKVDSYAVIDLDTGTIDFHDHD